MNYEMEKKECSEGGSSTSPDIQAFFDLIDREAYRKQLLDQMKDKNSKKQLANIVSTWQPVFELDDFKYLNDNGPRDLVKAPIRGKEGDSGETKEQRLMKGIKRERKLTPLLVSKKKMQKTDSGKGLTIDLNKKDESFDYSN